MGIFSRRRNRKELERLVDLSKAVEVIDLREEPTFAETEHLLEIDFDLLADARRDSIVPRSSR